MSPLRLAVLTPDPGDKTYAGRWQTAFAHYQTVFSAVGVELCASPWIATPPMNVDAALVTLVWGYHKQAARWADWLANTSINLINPLSIVRWNTDKRYLRGMAEAGAPVIPTLFVDAVDGSALAVAFETFATDRLVVKPIISAGSHQTAVVAPGEPPPAFTVPAMVQPFLNAVRAEGELSLFYFGGRFSHAARKVAAADDFRVQPKFGGQFSRMEPTMEMAEAAERALAAAPDGLVYARVDLIRDRDGALKLMEFEAIEPDLYFDLAPDAAPRFAEAVVAAIRC